MKKNVTPLFMFFGILFVACLLMANIGASKMIQIGPWAVTAGVLIFPISYIMSDVIAEVYGFKAARRIMWTGFGMNLLMVIYFQIAIHVAAPVWYVGSDAFASVLGNTPRLLAASLAAYVCGSFLNAAVISRMKVLTNGKYFGVRAIVSTMIGESVDSLIFVTLAFLGSIPADAMIPMIITQACMKTAYEVIVLPFTTFMVKRVKQYEGIDTYDKGVKYGLFR